MLINKESFDFAQTLIKYYSPNLKKKKIEQVQEEPEADIQHPKMETKTKYSVDYDKFDTYLDPSTQTKKLTPEEEEMNKIISQNPYLSQIACSHDRRKERELYDKSTEEKLDNAEYFKNEGNRFMKEKEYEKSSFFYQKALIHFDYAFPDTDKEQKRFDKLKEQCHSNMVLCKFFQQDYDESLTHCYQALKLNSNNTKVLFRKAKIYLIRDQFDECRKILEDLEVISKQDPEVRQLKIDLKLKEDQYDQTTSKMCKKFFEQ